MSQITTHILDTTKGKPAAGVVVVLFRQEHDAWRQIAGGTTNADGRIPDLLVDDKPVEHGTYRMQFETEAYFRKHSVSAFYPYVEIVFTIASNEHYHIPLLLSPFGYSTYRGS